jgi:hypothetical protein
MIYADNWNPPLPQLQKPISQDSETYSSKFEKLLDDSKTNKNLSAVFKQVNTSQLMQALNDLDKIIASKMPKQGGFDIDDTEINTTGITGFDKSVIKSIFAKQLSYDPKGQIPFPKEQAIIFIDDLANEDPF